jgi:hypothetical protein
VGWGGQGKFAGGTIRSDCNFLEIASDVLWDDGASVSFRTPRYGGDGVLGGGVVKGVGGRVEEVTNGWRGPFVSNHLSYYCHGEGRRCVKHLLKNTKG